MQWKGWSRMRMVFLGLGLLGLPLVTAAQTARRAGPAKRPVLKRRADTPEGRARDHWAETWEAASAKHHASRRGRTRRARAQRVARLCRPSAHGGERCAMVREIAWER